MRNNGYECSLLSHANMLGSHVTQLPHMIAWCNNDCYMQELNHVLIILQAIKVLNMIKLFGKAIRVNKASQDKDTLDVGANLFIGNLDPDVDEKVQGCDAA